MSLTAALRAVADSVDTVRALVTESLDLLDDAIGCLDVLTGSSQADVWVYPKGMTSQ